jgi:signal transduction histidine kinase
MVCIFYSLIDERQVQISYLFYSACTLACYFYLPLMNKQLMGLSFLIATTVIFAGHVNYGTSYLLLLLAAFYLFEANFYLKIKPYNYLLSGTAVFTFPYLLFYQNNLHMLTIILGIFLLLLFFYLHNLYRSVESQKIIYDQILAEYRKLKRQAIQNEKSIRAEERTRIAREMHDSVGHKLTAIGFQLEVFLMNQPNEQLRGIKVLVDESLDETRKAVRALQSEEVVGITSVINLIRKLEAESHLLVHFTTKQGVLNLSLSNKQSVALYRVIQEALTNVMKYSDGREVSVTFGISAKGDLNFQVINRVYQPNSFYEGFGIKSMKARLQGVGGSIHIYQTDQEFVVDGNLPL